MDSRSRTAYSCSRQPLLTDDRKREGVGRSLGCLWFLLDEVRDRAASGAVTRQLLVALTLFAASCAVPSFGFQGGPGARPGHCDNQTLDPGETDADCGAECAPCGPSRACAVNADCLLGFCSMGVCQDASCSNGVQDTSETDLDCGGG